MQFGSGSLAGGMVFIFAVNGSPVLFWIAMISIALTLVFLVHMIYKRREEAREAHEARAMVRKQSLRASR